MICPHGHDEGMVERVATPEEVDAGCELGVAFDPCPECAPSMETGMTIVSVDNPSALTLLGVPDYDHQAETGQGPPA